MASVKMLMPLCWAFLIFIQECLSNPTNIIIGGVLSSDEHLAEFAAEIKKLNAKLPQGSKYNFSGTSMKMNPNPLRSALSMCSDMIPKQVYTVVVSHPPNSDQSPISVSYTCGFYWIPVIGISARDSAFSDEKMHPTFLRTVPPYFHQADIWIRILQRYQWTSVIFMHSMDEEGREILYRFQTLADNNKIKIEKVLKYQPDEEDDIPFVLQEILPRQARVILLSASQEDAQKIFREADNLHVTGDTYAWIVSEKALAADNVPEGVLGATLQNIDESQHIKDSINLIGQGFAKLLAAENITEAPKECEDYRHKWNSGSTVLSYLKMQEVVNGSTGRLGFNEKGDRKYAVYDIKNVQMKAQKKTLVNVGIYGSKHPVKDQLRGLLDDDVVWPGGSREKPKGFRVKTKLKVVTIKEKPFVYTRLKEEGEECKRSEDELDCFHEDSTTKEMTNYCCRGYCMDLLWNLSQTINFTFELHLAKENRYGAYSKNSSTGAKEWNGMIKEILDEEAEMIVAPLTINPERAEVIDFSKPFKYQGLTILVKKTRKDSSLASFLQPFQDTLWILVGLSVHVVALVLYLLDRFSPFGRFKLAKTDDTEEDALNLSSAMWFAWGVLLNSGIGEGTPRSFSARVLGMVWAGFAMIIVASYTANLAAFLVLDRPEASITGVDDARLRNPQDTFKFATVKETSVEMYFKRQVELTTMYRNMEPRNKNSVDAAIADIMSEELQAFIWDSPRLEYEASRECDLITPGELFGRSGLGIGLPKNSLWTHQVSYQILSFHESGFMESLDNKWIHVGSESCQENNSAPATLGLTNMAGVFMMVAGGIVAGVILIFVEIAYKKHRGLKEKELELARNAADRWRGNIEKRKKLRETWDYIHELKGRRRQSAISFQDIKPPDLAKQKGDNLPKSINETSEEII